MHGRKEANGRLEDEHTVHIERITAAFLQERFFDFKLKFHHFGLRVIKNLGVFGGGRASVLFWLRFVSSMSS